jgi:hypothetical protein
MEYNAEPVNEPKFKCMHCLLILENEDLIGGACPKCGEKPKDACHKDHSCTCTHEIQSTGGLRCPECNAHICECGSHDVVVISRVTGYLAEVGGWGAGKQAEFNDRTRYDVGGLIS